ncbi:MAG: PAS domain S-box protein [Actinobacteria bacterium]|nr:PAS domain S-box protein [Actinomycetota bacterium]
MEKLRRRVRELEDVARDREEKAARLESLMRAAPLAIGLVSADRVLLEVNDYLCRMLGYSREELVGRSALVLYPSRDDFDFVGREKYVRIEERGVGSVETRWKSRDGEVIHVLLSSVRVDPSDPSAGTVFTALDITETKRAQEALRKEWEQAKSIFESIDQVIYVSDPVTYEILYVNKTVKDLFGKDPSGGICYKEFQGLEAPCPFCTNSILLKNPMEPYIWEYHNPILNRDYLIVDRMIRWPDGRDARFEFALDITETKRARERREKLNQVFMRLGSDILENIENILEGAEEILACRLAIYCLLVGERLSILTTAPGEEGFTVATDKENYLCYAFISGEARSPLVVPDMTGKPGIARDKLVEKYGLASFILYPVVVEGRTIGCLGCFDTRPREWTEEEIELAGMLAQAVSVEQERLDREEDLKDFIDVASHELRHPITVIKGYAQTLRELWPNIPSEKRLELLEAVEHGADRLERLVKELLDLSRIERGYFPLRREEVPVEPLLRAAAAELSNRGYLHVVNVVSRVGEDKVIADGDRLSLLLSILLDNAAKYSPQGSDIDLMVEERDAGLLFSVMDRGIGVPEGERERIFERFYQVEDALHHSIPGMGVGLYIARDIVESHGGRIWCEAREGGGTTFNFIIPRGG